MTVGSQLPEGEVTLVFTDIEGSTRLLHEIGDQFGDVLAEHDRVLRGVWEAFGGAVVKTDGDAFFVVFSDAGTAVDAAASAQRALADHNWPHGGSIRVRMGVHTGSPRRREADYWGVDVHYAARLCSAASGGQVLLSASSRGRISGVSLDDLGEHALRDFPAPRRLFHLRVDGRGAVEFPPPRTLARSRSNLPSPPNRLIGREHEVEKVGAALTGEVRLLTLTGVGGSGKTRLALACGAALIDSFADGVFFVPVASITGDAAVPAAIAHGIGIPAEDGREPERSILEHLAARQALLIVDNMEHLLGAAPLLSHLLEAAPGVRVLVTSQAPLRLRSEVVMAVGPLRIPDDSEVDVDSLEGIPAAELFLDRVRAADPAFRLDRDDAAALAELCRRLDGLPLALELAAPRVRLGGLRRLLAALERGIDGLGSGARDLPARQRGLRAALDYTVSLLDEQPRQLFAGLGAFADAWTIEQLERMFAEELDVWEASAALLDYSLIRTRGDGRLTMAEPIRSYTQSLLLRDGREEECRRQHAMMLAEDAEVIHDDIVFEMRSLSARTIELGREFAAAIRWSRAHEPGLHRRLVAALGIPYYLCTLLSPIADDIVAWVAGDGSEDAVSARLHLAHATVLISKGDVEAAWKAAGDAAQCSRQLGDPRGEVVAVAIQAQLVNQVGHKEPRTFQLLDAAMKLPVVQEDSRLRALLLGEIGYNHFVWGRLEEADALLSEIASDPRLEDSFIGMSAISVLGDCAMARGQFDSALRRFAACLRSSWGSTPIGALFHCWEIAGALAGLGRHREAIELASAVDAVAEQEGVGPVATSLYTAGVPELIAASRARLGEDAARTRQRSQVRDLDNLIDRALTVAEEHAAEEVGLPQPPAT